TITGKSWFFKNLLVFFSEASQPSSGEPRHKTSSRYLQEFQLKSQAVACAFVAVQSLELQQKLLRPLFTTLSSVYGRTYLQKPLAELCIILTTSLINRVISSDVGLDEARGNLY